MNKLLSLCFLALSILTATSDNPAFSSPSDFSSLSELSSPSSAYTEPVQEYNTGVFILSIPSSFEKITDQITTLLDSDGKPLAFRPAEFVRDASDSKDEITIYISFFDQDGDKPFNTLEENYNVINQTLLNASSETPSYKYIDNYLFGFTSEENSYFCSADFAIGTGIDTLLVEVICNELDDAISIRDQLMDTLKIDSPQQ